MENLIKKYGVSGTVKIAGLRGFEPLGVQYCLPLCSSFIGSVQNPHAPAPAETILNTSTIAISVPPEQINLNLQLLPRLHDHKAEQQEKRIVSNEIIGYSHKNSIEHGIIKFKEGVEIQQGR